MLLLLTPQASAVAQFEQKDVTEEWIFDPSYLKEDLDRRDATKKMLMDLRSHPYNLKIIILNTDFGTGTCYTEHQVQENTYTYINPGLPMPVVFIEERISASGLKTDLPLHSSLKLVPSGKKI